MSSFLSRFGLCESNDVGAEPPTSSRIILPDRGEIEVVGAEFERVDLTLQLTDRVLASLGPRLDVVAEDRREDDRRIDSGAFHPGGDRLVRDQIGEQHPAQVFVPHGLFAGLLNHILETVVGLPPIVGRRGDAEMPAESIEFRLREPEELEPRPGEPGRSTVLYEEGVDGREHASCMADERDFRGTSPDFDRDFASNAPSAAILTPPLSSTNLTRRPAPGARGRRRHSPYAACRRVRGTGPSATPRR